LKGKKEENKNIINCSEEWSKMKRWTRDAVKA
jgi:hypothetical protein